MEFAFHNAGDEEPSKCFLKGRKEGREGEMKSCLRAVQ